mmetsp:Transcript_39225/g.76127  ORF Transcript_39225/g.76127 Transcript_39225/m.76127 type:complete len:204 (-) Transcript_39225:19-630(-)
MKRHHNCPGFNREDIRRQHVREAHEILDSIENDSENPSPAVRGIEVGNPILVVELPYCFQSHRSEDPCHRVPHHVHNLLYPMRRQRPSKRQNRLCCAEPEANGHEHRVIVKNFVHVVPIEPRVFVRLTVVVTHPHVNQDDKNTNGDVCEEKSWVLKHPVNVLKDVAVFVRRQPLHFSVLSVRHRSILIHWMPYGIVHDPRCLS